MIIITKQPLRSVLKIITAAVQLALDLPAADVSHCVCLFWNFAAKSCDSIACLTCLALQFAFPFPHALPWHLWTL